MTAGLRATTVALGAVPVALLVAAARAPSPVSSVLGVVGALVVLAYLSVWLWWRPRAFEVDGAGLRIDWPLRNRRIPTGAIADATLLSAAEFRRDYGYGVRIGAGGLGGGFGLLRTARETFSLYVSRTDRVVLVSLRGSRSLLITPEAPERFVAEIRTRRA